MSPSVCPLQIDEGPLTEAPITSPAVETPSGSHEEKLHCEEPLPVIPETTSPKDDSCPKSMDPPMGSLTQDFFLDPNMPGTSQDTSPLFDQFVQHAGHVTPNPTISPNSSHVTVTDYPIIENAATNRASIGEINLPGPAFPNFSKTRQEVLVLSNVLGRIPQSFVSGEDPHQSMSFTVLDDVVPTTIMTTSSQEDLMASAGTDTKQQGTGQGSAMMHGKRRRPKYSLTGSMFKRHPVLKFSATGPLDCDKSPYKWWCRVCRVELSLMSRGSLELISHYRSDSHLIKEHRIRMEIPEMPLFNKDEKEILGVALKDAKKKAKDMYPITPQLDSLRPLVGQETVPDFSTSTSPSEKLFSQINILEFGLRHGGSVSSLTGMYEELVRLTSSDRLSVQNWSEQRLFVSISLYYINSQQRRIVSFLFLFIVTLLTYDHKSRFQQFLSFYRESLSTCSGN